MLPLIPVTPTSAPALAPLSAPAVTPTSAPAAVTTVARLAPRLLPDRLGARGALAFTISYSGAEAGVPAPVRRLLLRFPKGLGLDVPLLRTCNPMRLRSRGVRGCPAQSSIGSGHALVETRTGAAPLSEEVSLHAFIGPARELQPTLEILGRGYTPLDESLVFTGSSQPDRPPYGEALVMPVPPIPTLALEPDASIVSFTLEIGSTAAHPGANAVVLPARCAAGGFPFAAQSTYADGSTNEVLAKVPCPS